MGIIRASMVDAERQHLFRALFCDGRRELVKTVCEEQLVRVRTARPHQAIPEKTDPLPPILCRPTGANRKDQKQENKTTDNTSEVKIMAGHSRNRIRLWCPEAEHPLR